ncbi:TetR/AcrR family transcriptional regulator [Leptospira idonii]|uniref:TetR/AcrR family transcriptional regulator n=1 Tax=Leptospira idonii TaxID=1193500 RepID=A0A4R9LU75_9LEPT|nr:TetR/AcrR family transcriptional regulator [Leptospira idonii]TGN17326.1 TetR/AcrR family transcriptional regulator [Leptospira idonii]
MAKKNATPGAKTPTLAPSKKSKSANTESSYHHGDLRNTLLVRSESILEEKGVGALSLRDVASELGVSHAAPYRHFPRKIDLLFALAARGFSDLSDAMQKSWSVSEDPLEKLKASGRAYIMLVLDHPRRTELMFGGDIQCEEAPDDLKKIGQEAYLGLYRIVEFGQKEGVLKKTVPTPSLSMSVWSAVHGFAVLNERTWREAKTSEAKKRMEEQIDILLRIVIDGSKEVKS